MDQRHHREKVWQRMGVARSRTHACGLCRHADHWRARRNLKSVSAAAESLKARQAMYAVPASRSKKPNESTHQAVAVGDARPRHYECRARTSFSERHRRKWRQWRSVQSIIGATKMRRPSIREQRDELVGASRSHGAPLREAFRLLRHEGIVNEGVPR